MKRTNTLHMMLLAAAVALIISTIWAPAAVLAATNPIRIHFAQGATSAVVSGNLPANGTSRYVIRAGASQLMQVTLSASKTARLKITNTSGHALAPIPGTSSTTGFRGYLPYTGDYYITVAAGNKAISYSVDVFIPVRIKFASGATSSTLKAHLRAHQGLGTIAGAKKGQILEVIATPAKKSASLQLIIYGVDGTVLRSGMGEGSSFRGVLPLTEDYIISVRAGEVATDFTLQVIVPQRIHFASGSTTGSVNTSLLSGHTQYYVLGASKNQTMKVVATPDTALKLAVYGMDGTVLKSANSGGASFKGTLPKTQDYFLAVTNTGNPLNFRLSVTIK